MSLRTWTPAELQSESRRYAGTIWRCVEAQHRVSTMRLADLVPEQAILERVLEESKPPTPVSDRLLDYLLSTPFRYSPHRSGSRFRRREQREGVFYAAEVAVTALCEVAFYRFLFLADAPDALVPSNAVEHTAFSVQCSANHAIDLTAPPLSADAAIWEAPDRYAPCQALADSARTANISIIRYTSVRDLLRRANVALLSASAFTVVRPVAKQSWRLLIKPHIIIAFCENPKEEWEFPLSGFAADPRLAPLLNKRGPN